MNEKLLTSQFTSCMCKYYLYLDNRFLFLLIKYVAIYRMENRNKNLILLFYFCGSQQIKTNFLTMFSCTYTIKSRFYTFFSGIYQRRWKTVQTSIKAFFDNGILYWTKILRSKRDTKFKKYICTVLNIVKQTKLYVIKFLL